MPLAKFGVIFTVILTLNAVLVILPINQVLLLVFPGELLMNVASGGKKSSKVTFTAKPPVTFTITL